MKIQGYGLGGYSYSSAAGNQAEGTHGYGGGIALWTSEFETLLYSTTVFENNMARLGGSGYLITSDLSLDGAVSFWTSSAAFGGGLFMYAMTSLQCRGRCKFAVNIAGISGGGLYADGRSTVAFDSGSDVAFENNSCTHSGGGATIQHGSSMILNSSAVFEGMRQLDYRLQSNVTLFS